MSHAATKSSITIKKYANRRLYNTATSTYVTLEDLCAMVKEGTEFNVYDAKSSEDITRSVLTQIIVEEEGKSGQQNLLPINFLRQLISFYGDNLQWMVPKYLKQSMEALTNNQEKIRSYFQTSFGSIFPFGTTLEEMGKQNMAMFERTMQMFNPFGIATLPETTTYYPFSFGGKTEQEEKAPTLINEPAANKNVQDMTPKPAMKAVETPTASVTNLKPRQEQAATSVQTTPAATTPMPNVQATTASTGTDDMQQKIANLQRQLADLAKSRA